MWLSRRVLKHMLPQMQVLAQMQAYTGSGYSRLAKKKKGTQQGKRM